MGKERVPTKKFCDMFKKAEMAARNVAEMTSGSSGLPNRRRRIGVIFLRALRGSGSSSSSSSYTHTCRVGLDVTGDREASDIIGRYHWLRGIPPRRPFYRHPRRTEHHHPAPSAVGRRQSSKMPVARKRLSAGGRGSWGCSCSGSGSSKQASRGQATKVANIRPRNRPHGAQRGPDLPSASSGSLWN